MPLFVFPSILYVYAHSEKIVETIVVWPFYSLNLGYLLICILDRMTTLLNVQRVKYQCNCGAFKSLCYLYFCRHCLKIKCKDCVILEVSLMERRVRKDVHPQLDTCQFLLKYSNPLQCERNFFSGRLSFLSKLL
jgi:hypothetical protein